MMVDKVNDCLESHLRRFSKEALVNGIAEVSRRYLIGQDKILRIVTEELCENELDKLKERIDVLLADQKLLLSENSWEARAKYMELSRAIDKAFKDQDRWCNRRFRDISNGRRSDG